MKPITVHVVRGDRTFWMMRYSDPDTGRLKQKSSKALKKRDALKAAAQWELKLNEGRADLSLNPTWQAFRAAYAAHHLSSLKRESDKLTSGVLDSYERELKPGRLTSITALTLATYQTKLRGRGLEPVTIAGHLRMIAAALRWAKSMKLMAEVPVIPKTQRARSSKVMRGRPISDAEFKRMRSAVPQVIGAKLAPAWQSFLDGLYLSGLRMEESLQLYWDHPEKLSIDMTGRHPMMRIRGNIEKGGKDRLLPIAPEFAEWLAKFPKSKRTGPVFTFPARRPNKMNGVRSDWVSKIVAKFGKAAGVVVDERKGRKKYASAHDLRRAFGARWARRVMPTVLKELMRHEDITTTLRYYVGEDAAATADVLWAAHDTSHDTTKR